MSNDLLQFSMFILEFVKPIVILETVGTHRDTIWV